MSYDKHVEQTVVNTCAGSDLETAPGLAAVPDDCHRAASSDFAIRQDEPSVIFMNVHRQNCAHHSVRGRAKQAFEFWRSGRCDLGAKTTASCVYEPGLIGLTHIDWYCLTFQTERQCLLRVTRNAASGSEVIRSP